MDMKFKDTKFESKLKELIEAMTNNEGPYLIHCVEGKDRTGYISMNIESLAGATYDEIVNDYMITYDNYYDININTDKGNLKKINFEERVNNYLLSIGITQENINLLKSKIKK